MISVEADVVAAVPVMTSDDGALAVVCFRMLSISVKPVSEPAAF